MNIIHVRLNIFREFSTILYRNLITNPVHLTATIGDLFMEWVAGTVEVFVGDNAELKFVELQSLSENCYHFSHEKSQVGRDGRLDWVFSAIGSKITKSFLDLE